MSINKVVYGSRTLIDLTSDNVTAAALVSGYSAHGSNGEVITGTIIARTESDIGVAGPTISVPSGAYPSAATKTIASGSVQVNSVVAVKNPSISLNSATGVINAANTGSVSISATVTSGYVTSANNGTMTFSGSSSFALPTQAAITINPTESEQTAVASGKYTIGNITVAAISSNYVGSNIAQRSSGDLVFNNGSFTTPSGYYINDSYKNISVGGNITKPGLSLNYLTGKITASISVSSAWYTASTSNNTLQLSTISAATITPTESSQVAAASSKFTLGNITVAAISSDYIGSNISQRSPSDIGVAGPIVTIPSGYYSEEIEKTVATGKYTTSFSGTINPTISVSSTGLVTVVGDRYANLTPVYSSGYVEPFQIQDTTTVNSSYQLNTQAATTISPIESEQTAVAAGKFTTGIVKVGAISSNYVGSNITARSSSDLSVSGATVTAPSGYYATAAATTIASGTATTPATTITSQPTITVSSDGLITATNNKTQNVTPTVSAGYISNGTAGTITVNGSNTSQLATKAATTIIPSIADTTIDSGVFLIGSQTIKGDSHLVGENIAAGTSIFGINGSYTGSAAVITETVESGKTIVNIDTGDIYHWAGLDMEFVQDLGSVSWTLDDTTYSEWTPSTSASKQIKTTVNVTTFSANMTDYEYLILWNVVINCAYDNGYTDTARFVKQYETLASYLHRRPSTFVNLDSGIFNGNVAINYSAYLSDYYNSSNTHTLAYQASYGFWMTVTSPTFSSSTSNTPTITVKSPAVSTRCSTAYFSTDNAAKINTTNTTLKAYAKLYRCPVARSFSYNLFKDLVDYRNLTERL